MSEAQQAGRGDGKPSKSGEADGGRGGGGVREGGGEGAKGGSLKTDMTTIDGLRAAGGEKGGGLEHFVAKAWREAGSLVRVPRSYTTAA